MSIGYDIGTGVPPLTNAQIAGFYNMSVPTANSDGCNDVRMRDSVAASCPTHGAGGANCPIPYVFCLKRIGVDCI